MARRLLILMAVWCLTATPVAFADGDPILPARAYLLMDATTGRVLHEYNGHLPMPMASTTKIMTAVLALEQAKLDDVVTAGEAPYATGGTTMYLEIGERQSLRNLLYALMLESANDAGVAIAEHLAGTEARFAERMNEKAIAIGAKNSHFVNSHGLHDPDHYSTAYDLALIARYAMQNAVFRALVTTEEVDIPGAGDNPPRPLYNKNRLLGYYQGANGVKNGFTEEAGLTNVASARRGQTELIAVILGAEDRVWTSSMALLDFGFERYETLALPAARYVTTVTRPTDLLTAAPATDVLVTLPKGAGALTHQMELQPAGTEPLKLGDTVGHVVFQHLGDEVGRAPLIVAAISAVGAVTTQPVATVLVPTGPSLGWWPALGLGAVALAAAGLITIGLNFMRSRFR